MSDQEIQHVEGQNFQNLQDTQEFNAVRDVQYTVCPSYSDSVICGTCGSLVWNPQEHDEWHQRMGG